jgi:hypothetical protein
MVIILALRQYTLDHWYTKTIEDISRAIGRYTVCVAKKSNIMSRAKTKIEVQYCTEVRGLF